MCSCCLVLLVHGCFVRALLRGVLCVPLLQLVENVWRFRGAPAKRRLFFSLSRQSCDSSFIHSTIFSHVWTTTTTMNEHPSNQSYQENRKYTENLADTISHFRTHTSTSNKAYTLNYHPKNGLFSSAPPTTMDQSAYARHISPFRTISMTQKGYFVGVHSTLHYFFLMSCP